MVNISLNKHKFALIDLEDQAVVQDYKWFVLEKGGIFYAVSTIYDKTTSKRIRVYMHHVILGNGKIDHRNGDGLDNRKCNLRKCTTSQNAANSKLNKKNTSGYKGVTWSKRGKKWAAQIKVNYKNHYLGLFVDSKDAAKAYNEAAIKYFGEFAKLNEII